MQTTKRRVSERLAKGDQSKDRILPMDRLKMYCGLIADDFNPLIQRLKVYSGSINVRERAKYELGLYDLYTQKTQLEEKLHLVKSKIEDIERPGIKLAYGWTPVSPLDIKVKELLGLTGEGALAADIEASRDSFIRAVKLAETRADALEILEEANREAVRLSNKVQDHLSDLETNNIKKIPEKSDHES
jgi:hypothetical protein